MPRWNACVLSDASQERHSTNTMRPTMRTTRVLILYNQPVLPAGHRDAESEHEVVETVNFVDSALTAAGYAVGRLGVERDAAALVGGIRKARPDVVFNL